jgi:TolB-like protein
MRILAISCVFFALQSVAATVYPAAILPFAERGADVRYMGNQVSELLFASLVVEPDIFLVDRDENAILGELALNASGLVDPAKATEVGRLTGAKLLISGSVMMVGKKLIVVARIIGTETSRVVGASAKGDLDSELDVLVEELGAKVIETTRKRYEELMPVPRTFADQLAAIKKQVPADAKLPSVYIKIVERHVNRNTIAPAAETEMALFCSDLGFKVIDEAGKKKADLHITGEGFSEFATRRGELIAVKCRLEVKAVDPKTDEVVAIKRQNAVAVDLTEQIAGKSALQMASAEIAKRMLPKLVR